MSSEVLRQVRAEVVVTRETAERVAHDGPQPRSDAPRVLAGLISQLAEQVERLVDTLASAPDGTIPAVDGQIEATTPVASRTPDVTPNQADAPAEEDTSSEQAPAKPLRPV
jgi:hypothetical protein